MNMLNKIKKKYKRKIIKSQLKNKLSILVSEEKADYIVERLFSQD